MRYGSNGVLQYAPHNLLTYSQAFDNAAWTKSNSFVQTNLVLNSEALSTQNVTTTATPYTLSFYGTGTVTLSGTSTTGPLVGTGASNRVTLTFTPTAGTLTLTVTGSVTQGQLVQGSVPGDYVATTSAALPVAYASWGGTLTAKKLCENTSGGVQHVAISGSVSVTANAVTLSVRAKAGERSLMGLYANTIGKGQYFNLANGTIGATLISAPYSANITALGGGWYLCTITVIAGATEGLSVYLTDGSTITYTGDGSSGIYIADAQLCQGYLPLQVTTTTSAAVYGPRFDYDPVTLTARGLLIEEQRVNRFTFSNTFSDASWTAVGTKTVAVSGTNSPEGVANAWTLTDGSAVSIDGIQKTDTVAADGSAYAHSIFVLKTSGGTSTTFGVNLGITGGTAVSNNVRINTDLGTVLAGTATVTNSGSYWRVASTVTNNSSVGNVTLTVQILPATAAYNSGTDVVTATGSATIYQSQDELGAFATSPITTVGSTGTRNADSASITTLTPWFNAAAGTIFAVGARINISVSGNLLEFGDGTNNNRFFVYGNPSGSSGSYMVVNGGITQASIDVLNGFLTNTTGKIAAAYALNDFQQATNATLGIADTSGTIPTVTAAYIGKAGSGLTAQWNGWIASIRYYPTRLPNASLQSITV